MLQTGIKKGNPEHSADVTKRPRTIHRVPASSCPAWGEWFFLTSAQLRISGNSSRCYNTVVHVLKSRVACMNNAVEGKRAVPTRRPALLAGGEWPSPCRLSWRTVHTACPGLELLSCELLAKSAAVADVLVYRMYTKHRHELCICHAWKEGMKKTLERPLPSFWAWTRSLLNKPTPTLWSSKLFYHGKPAPGCHEWSRRWRSVVYFYLIIASVNAIYSCWAAPAKADSAGSIRAGSSDRPAQYNITPARPLSTS